MYRITSLMSQLAKNPLAKQDTALTTRIVCLIPGSGIFPGEGNDYPL